MVGIVHHQPSSTWVLILAQLKLPFKPPQLLASKARRRRTKTELLPCFCRTPHSGARAEGLVAPGPSTHLADPVFFHPRGPAGLCHMPKDQRRGREGHCWVPFPFGRRHPNRPRHPPAHRLNAPGPPAPTEGRSLGNIPEGKSSRRSELPLASLVSEETRIKLHQRRPQIAYHGWNRDAAS